MALSARTLVVLRALGLGDLLTAVPALRALAAAVPTARLVLAAPPWLAPLALGAALADEVLPTAGLQPLHDVGRGWTAVNLHGRGPESHRCLLATGPARLLAFHHPAIPETASSPCWRLEEHEVARWCRLLVESGVAADPTDLLLDPDRLPAIPLPADATVLHPGAAQPARRWPPDRWAQVARAELRRGRAVVVTAGPGEQAAAEQVRAGAGSGAISLHAPADVLELAGLVKAAARVVSSDTGIAHLATALARPSVVLFGPTPPARWGPPDWHPHRTIWKGAVGDPRADRPDAGLLRITSGEVVAALGTVDARPLQV